MKKLPHGGEKIVNLFKDCLMLEFVNNTIKFSGIQYHLYHKERIHNNINNNILQSTIKNNTTWCRFGIDGYL